MGFLSSHLEPMVEAGHGEGKDPLAEVSEMNHIPVSQGLLPLTCPLGTSLSTWLSNGPQAAYSPELRCLSG